MSLHSALAKYRGFISKGQRCLQCMQMRSAWQRSNNPVYRAAAWIAERELPFDASTLQELQSAGIDLKPDDVPDSLKSALRELQHAGSINAFEQWYESSGVSAHLDRHLAAMAWDAALTAAADVTDDRRLQGLSSYAKTD